MSIVSLTHSHRILGTIAGCAIGGECICQVCMGAIVVKRVKTSPKHSSAKRHWNRIKDAFVSTDGSRKRDVESTISSDDENRKRSSDSPVSFFRFRKKASLKRLRNPSSLLNTDIDMNMTYDRFREVYPKLDREQWKCVLSVYVLSSYRLNQDHFKTLFILLSLSNRYGGACVYKKLDLETFFRKRYVWVNVTKSRKRRSKEWGIHWCKSDKKHVHNKTLNVRNDVHSVKRQGKCIIEIQCQSSHPSVVLKFDTETKTDQWFKGLNAILIMCDQDNDVEKLEEKEEEE